MKSGGRFLTPTWVCLLLISACAPPQDPRTADPRLLDPVEATPAEDVAPLPPEPQRDWCGDFHRAHDDEPTALHVLVPKTGPTCVGPRAVFDVDDLSAAAELAKAEGAERAVVHSEAEVKYARIVATLDMLHQAGLSRVGMQVVQPAPVQPAP